MTPRPIRLRLRLVQWLRRISVRRQQRRQTSAYFHRQHFRQAIAVRIERQDGLRRGTRGSRTVGLLLGNYQIVYLRLSTDAPFLEHPFLALRQPWWDLDFSFYLAAAFAFAFSGYVLSIARRTSSAIEAPVLLFSSSSRFICRGNKLRIGSVHLHKGMVQRCVRWCQVLSGVAGSIIASHEGYPMEPTLRPRSEYPTFSI